MTRPPRARQTKINETEKMANLTQTMHKQQTYIPQTEQGKQTQVYTRKKQVYTRRTRTQPVYRGTRTGQKEAEGKNVRKRETMCETTHRKAKKKNKRDPDKCNRKQEMYIRLHSSYTKPSPGQATPTP